MQAAAEMAGAPPARASRFWRRLRRNRLSFGALIVLAAIALAAALAPWVAPFDPNAPDAMASLAPPSWPHLLGTDLYGRDQLSRIIHAGRVNLLIACGATLGALALGAVIGAVAGYRGGWVDQVIMRATDSVMAFPAFVLAMGITAAIGNSLLNVALAIGVTQVPSYIRLVRGEMLRVREMEYADAARTVGNPDRRIVLVHLLPNCIPPMIVQATLAMGYAILTLAALSYLGLGIRPPQSEWGQMTAEGASELVTGAWWLFLFPGAAIVVTVLAFNLLGDGLRDLLDPRMRGL
jgi:peptide/nickel transport system permease protein